MLRVDFRFLVCAALVYGCTASPPPRAKSNPNKPNSAAITNTDACATRLQDISGDLLLYYATYRHLPNEMGELENVPGLEMPELVCPVSHRPYIYDRVGVFLPRQQTRVILYDPTPAHSGFRWAISASEPQAGKPLIMKVIAVPESDFTSLGSQP
jgi:hypothetical protein